MNPSCRSSSSAIPTVSVKVVLVVPDPVYSMERPAALLLPVLERVSIWPLPVAVSPLMVPATSTPHTFVAAVPFSPSGSPPSLSVVMT